MRTTRPMTIHIHIGGEPDPFDGVVALALGCTTGAGAAELGGTVEVTVTDGTEGLELMTAEELGLSAGEELAVRLAIALLMLLPMLELHAVAMPAAQRSVAAKSRFPVSRRIDGPFPHLSSMASPWRRPGQRHAFSLASPHSRRVTPNG